MNAIFIQIYAIVFYSDCKILSYKESARFTGTTLVPVYLLI